MFYLSTAAVPHMRPGAAIVNTTSIQSKSPSPQLLAYAATKGAISNFTAALAQMLADRGIRVNAVAPGPIWTLLIPSPVPTDKAASFGQQVPLSRSGQPNELAPAFVLLASDEASYISGAVVPVTVANRCCEYWVAVLPPPILRVPANRLATLPTSSPRSPARFTCMG